jgi:hypothetical protein
VEEAIALSIFQLLLTVLAEICVFGLAKFALLSSINGA